MEVTSERARFVLANGFAASHPDYRIRIDETVKADVGLRSGNIPIELDPRPPHPLTRGPEAMRPETIELLPSGGVAQPHLKPWRMTSAILGPAELQPVPMSANDRELLNLHDPKHRLNALIVVWLSEPTAEEAVNFWLREGIDVAIFTEPNAARVPVSWDASFCGDRALPCPKDQLMSASEGFKSWVSSLRNDDATLLNGIGLDLTDLRNRAKSGKMHGFIATAELEEIKFLSRRSQVKSIQLVSIDLADARD
ncbi:hypothetical protein ACFXJ8_43980 [Nonomuraea sp. NPDC059194]|uniref:hypothetical protein n=1 Tax=Nonomuraea sp. NPDC059194 TaxID=3346764 RepID=UPI0036A3318C